MVEWRIMRRLFGFILQTLILLSLPLSLVAWQLLTPAAHAQNERLVLAFYYAWFDQATWSSGQLSDQPAQPYDSRDREAIQRHVAQAKSAGIDALVQSWYGPTGGVNNMTESNFAMLLDVAQASGLRAAVDLEITGPFFGSAGDVQGALATLLAGHARHPAYLKVGGQPVIFFWRQQRFSVDQWEAIRRQVDPDRASIWIAEGTDLAYLRVFDGIHLYSVAWSADPETVLVNFGAKVRKAAQNLGGFRYWVATAMPGYDDVRLRGASGFVRPRADGDYYRATFAGASKSGADWLIVTSFNEWLEGSQIEPSVSYGDTYLNLTRDLAAAYRTSTVIAPTVPPAPSPTETVSVTPTEIPSPLEPSGLRPMSVPTVTMPASPTPSPTVTITPSPSPTSTATSTSTSTPTATASATLSPTIAPTEISFPTQTSTPVQVSGPADISPGVWVVVGISALVSGVILGSISARHRTAR
jgi:hypothetical protein